MLPSKSFPSHTITFLPGPNEFSGFIVLLIFPARLNILAVTLSELDKSNKIFVNEKVATKFAEVKAPEWEIATFLPLAQFEKATKQKIYADSRKML